MTDGCSRIFKFKMNTLVNGIKISVLVISLNAILQTLIAIAIKKIGLNTQTCETQYM